MQKNGGRKSRETVSLKYRCGMRIFTYEIVLQNIPFQKMLRTRNEDCKFKWGHIHFSGVNDPADVDQELINCLIKETVCMAF
jgi:hypothetical protein